MDEPHPQLNTLQESGHPPLSARTVVPTRVRTRTYTKHSVARNTASYLSEGDTMNFLRNLWGNEEGQDIAEYAVMLAVILVIVVGTIRLIGSNANNVFSTVASSIQ